MAAGAPPTMRTTVTTVSPRSQNNALETVALPLLLDYFNGSRTHLFPLLFSFLRINCCRISSLYLTVLCFAYIPDHFGILDIASAL